MAAKKKAEPKVTAQSLRDEINAALKIDTLKMGSDPSFTTKYIPTGLWPIDLMFGGGVPRNRYTYLYGGFSTLKSYICYCAIAACQAQGGIAALADTEHVFDDAYVQSLGVNTDDLLIVPTTTAEEALDISEATIRGGCDLLVWDSIAASLPQVERNGRMFDSSTQMARQAAFMSAGLRKLTAANRRTAIMFTNQTREKVGITFGNPETQPGGRSMPFYASYTLKMAKAGKVESAATYFLNGTKLTGRKKIEGHHIRATLEKSKLNTGPGREYNFVFDLNTGAIDELGFVISQAMEFGLVSVSGNAHKIKGSTKSHPHKPAFLKYLLDNPAIVAKLKEQIWASTFPGSHAPVNKTAGAPKLKLRVKKA